MGVILERYRGTEYEKFAQSYETFKACLYIADSGALVDTPRLAEELGDEVLWTLFVNSLKFGVRHVTGF